MKLDFIDLGKLSVSKANMRCRRPAPDVSDLLPTVRKRKTFDRTRLAVALIRLADLLLELGDRHGWW